LIRKISEYSALDRAVCSIDEGHLLRFHLRQPQQPRI
jgi:hypothetical protein